MLILEKLKEAMGGLESAYETDRKSKEGYRGELDSQVELRRREREERDKREEDEERQVTGLRFREGKKINREEWKQGLLSQIEEKEWKKKEERERELSAERDVIEMVKRAEKGEWQTEEDGELLREQRSTAKRWDLEDLAGSVGLNLVDFKGNDKRECREFIERKIREKEEEAKGNKVY